MHIYVTETLKDSYSVFFAYGKANEEDYSLSSWGPSSWSRHTGQTGQFGTASLIDH